MNESDFRRILAEYEEIRERNNRILDERKREVTEKLPEYRELETEAASVASSYGKKSIAGDDNALKEMDKLLSEIEKKRTSLLKNSDFPEDYLSPVYTCPDCKDTGYIGNDKCHCLKQRIINALYLQSHLTGILERENFDNSDMSLFPGEIREEMTNVYSAAKDFVNKFDLDYRNMLFLGNVGSGKTFLTNCIAKALLDKGFSVIYFSAIRLFELLADNTFRQTEFEDRSGFTSNIYESDLLIIDDLGTENTNSFVVSQLFNVLNERHIRRKATIISSNLSLKNIKDIYSERSLSRIIGNYELYYFRGKDLRIPDKV